MANLELLPSSEFEIIRTLRLRGPKWVEFDGIISYSRTIREGYNATDGDVLDTAILASLNEYSIEVINLSVAQILFTTQKDSFLRPWRRFPTNRVEFTFTPMASHLDLLELQEPSAIKTFPIYRLAVGMAVLYTGSSIGDLSDIPTTFFCPVHYKELTQKLIATIRPATPPPIVKSAETEW